MSLDVVNNNNKKKEGKLENLFNKKIMFIHKEKNEICFTILDVANWVLI